MGLSVAYKREEKPRHLKKNFLAHPRLPLRDMLSQFSQLQDQFEESGDQMQGLYQYVTQTWFGSSDWKPRDICAYQRLVRTNVQQ